MVLTYILCLIFHVFACVMLLLGGKFLLKKLSLKKRVFQFSWVLLLIFYGGLVVGGSLHFIQMSVYYDTNAARHKFVFDYLGVPLDSEVVETPVSEKYRILVGPFPEPSWKYVRDWPYNHDFREEIRKYVVDEFTRHDLLYRLNEERPSKKKKKEILRNYLDIFAGEGDWREKEDRAEDYLEEVRDALDNR